ncbi:MAG TPA: DUF1684 domain-containing protein [Acidobacteria bacterium]|nr:DUF1684 domain-containing protein [Acidobacteriota bacterium]
MIVLGLRPVSSRHRAWLCRALLGLLLLGAACQSAPPPPDAALVDAVEAYRAARQARLTAEDGWLSLVGLYWLHPGSNRVGSADDADVILPPDVAPAEAGVLVLEAGRVLLRAHRDSALEIDGHPFTEQVLVSDAAGEPTIVEAGRVSFYVIDRDGRLGVRVKDPEAPARRAFSGLEYFPIDPRWKVLARWVPFEQPREVRVANVIGQVTETRVGGRVEFDFDGRTYSLLPLVDDPFTEDLFFVFADATNGEQTYHAGRFLTADPIRDGRVELDFNRAYNPPCAFTRFATCPLPPADNRLKVAVEAGEKAYHGPH